VAGTQVWPGTRQSEQARSISIAAVCITRRELYMGLGSLVSMHVIKQPAYQ
jgi:2,3-bisphosphoglycerate-independent phosphoglycerate mutase